jgi:mannitol/fructose-specific phosphotransferase system IIA component (Ntr-type)
MTANDAAPTRSGRGEPKSALALGQFTAPRLLAPRLLSTRQEDVIQELATRLEATGRIPDAAAFTAAVSQRELNIPTFAGEGVVVPHGRGGAVRSLSLAVGLAAAGIPWGRDHHLNAHVIFLFAIPLAESSTYLALLSGLSTLIRDEVAFAALSAAKQPEDMLRVLHAVRVVRRASCVAVPCRS